MLPVELPYGMELVALLLGGAELNSLLLEYALLNAELLGAIEVEKPVLL